MKRRLFIHLLAVPAIMAFLASARAQDWSYFWSIGNGVSVSFARVDNGTYTWKFRNDGYNKITYMKFTYSYIDSNTGMFQTQTDFLPGSLRPGEVIGGWTAFTANSRSQPTIMIRDITRE